MTDSKTVVEDLAAWLTQIWDEEERVARTFDWARPDQYETGELDASPEYVTLYMPPNQLLARIAADRKILAHCLDVIGGEPLNAWYDGASPAIVGETTIRLLASPYADRPGFRPEWSVERLGVER